MQSQEDFSEANAILDGLGNPLHFIGYKSLSELLIIPKENFQFPHFARAPPSVA